MDVSPAVLVGSSLAYLLLVKVLSTYMANRAAFECREVMIIYNIAQIALCGYMTVGITKLLMEEAPIWEPLEGTAHRDKFLAPHITLSR